MDGSKNDFHTVPPTQNFNASAADVQNAFDGVSGRLRIGDWPLRRDNCFKNAP